MDNSESTILGLTEKNFSQSLQRRTELSDDKLYETEVPFKKFNICQSGFLTNYFARVSKTEIPEFLIVPIL